MQVESPPDRILIEGVQFRGRHGVAPEERTLGNRFTLDLTLEFDLRLAGATDRIEDTINYARVLRTVVEIGTTSSYHLIEALAARIADEVMAAFPVSAVQVRLRKLTAPVEATVQSVGVEITRRKAVVDEGTRGRAADKTTG